MNKKGIIKLITILSCTAVLSAFSANVYADSLLSELPSDGCTIDIISSGTKTELENKPFIENGEVYLPIREVTNKLDDTAEVNWDNGTVSVAVNEKEYLLTIGKKDVSINPAKADEATYTKSAENTAVLKNDRTFVPYSMLEIIFNSSEPSGRVNYAVYNDTRQYEKTAVWADALITRNGKPRYEIMTADMQNKFIENQKEYIGGEDWNYTIGYSSPQTVSYNIVSLDNKSEIVYYQTDNSKEEYVITEKLTFENKNGNLLVSESEIIDKRTE